MNISILGCGWLGFPLAKSLVDNGFSVKGSSTSESKLSILSTAGILPYIVSLSAVEVCEVTKKAIELFLENSEFLIINIPPKLRGGFPDTSTALSKTFVSKIKNLIPFIEQSSVKKVIFVSSTSVYADNTSYLDCTQHGTLGVTEETKPQPETESGKQLLESETLLLSNSNFQTIVVRFGGLIGEDRHPVHFLAGQKNIDNPEAPINLIHQNDCIGIIEAILIRCTEQNDNIRENETFNAVTPFHPTRKDYYTQKAVELNLSLPEFDSSKPSFWKINFEQKRRKFVEISI